MVRRRGAPSPCLNHAAHRAHAERPDHRAGRARSGGTLEVGPRSTPGAPLRWVAASRRVEAFGGSQPGEAGRARHGRRRSPLPRPVARGGGTGGPGLPPRRVRTALAASAGAVSGPSLPVGSGGSSGGSWWSKNARRGLTASKGTETASPRCAGEITVQSWSSSSSLTPLIIPRSPVRFRAPPLVKSRTTIPSPAARLRRRSRLY